MAGPASVFSQIGQSMGASKSPGAAAPSTAHSKGGASKPFDIGMYFTAVGMFFSDFFGKKLPYFFKNIGPVMSNFPNWWGKLKQDEQISYGVLMLGHVMLIVGVVLFIIL